MKLLQWKDRIPSFVFRNKKSLYSQFSLLYYTTPSNFHGSHRHRRWIVELNLLNTRWPYLSLANDFVATHCLTRPRCSSLSSHFACVFSNRLFHFFKNTIYFSISTTLPGYFLLFNFNSIIDYRAPPTPTSIYILIKLRSSSTLS